MADEIDRPDIIIEGNTAKWDMKVDGDINGTYIGEFRFRCFLTPVQQIAANREYRDMLGPNMTMAPEHESFLAYCLTQLKYRILSAPPFWGSSSVPGDIPDDNVLLKVLDAAVSAETKFRGNIKKKKEEAIQKAMKAAERLLKQQDEDDRDESPSEESRD